MCNCKNCKENEYELLPDLEIILENYTGSYRNEYETGGGRSRVAARPSFVRNFSGPVAECTAALTRAGKTQAQALAIINAQIAVAIQMLRNADTKLKQGSRSARTNQIFQRIFRVRPSFVPQGFTPTATNRDRGDVVAIRCRKVAELLASGRLRFFCKITAANCPDCGDDNRPFACSSWGDHRVICLGSLFWDAMRNNELASLRSTLMHEPFHILFGRYVTQHDKSSGAGTRHVGKFGGIRCILQFVFEINGQVAQVRDSQGCSGTMVRSKATGF